MLNSKINTIIFRKGDNMTKFKSLVDSSVKQAEAEVSKYWNEVNILEKTLEKGKNDP